MRSRACLTLLTGLPLRLCDAGWLSGPSLRIESEVGEGGRALTDGSHRLTADDRLNFW